MNKIFVALTIAILGSGSAVASQEKEATVPVHQFVDGFNKGDTKSAIAACAERTSIIDEFPPHEWHGAGACANGRKDYDTEAKKNGITDGVVTLGKLRHIEVTGDRAYVVVPADYAFKQKGKAMKEAGLRSLLPYKKGKAGWRIVGWLLGEELAVPH